MSQTTCCQNFEDGYMKCHNGFYEGVSTVVPGFSYVKDWMSLKKPEAWQDTALNVVKTVAAVFTLFVGVALVAGALSIVKTVCQWCVLDSEENAINLSRTMVHFTKERDDANIARDEAVLARDEAILAKDKAIQDLDVAKASIETLTKEKEALQDVAQARAHRIQNLVNDVTALTNDVTAFATVKWDLSQQIATLKTEIENAKAALTTNIPAADSSASPASPNNLETT